MEKKKETIVTNKVKSNAVKINSCVPITNEELTEIIECSQLGRFNFINVSLKHVDDKQLIKRCNQFIEKMKEQTTLVLLQKAGLYEKRYTVVTNKNLFQIRTMFAKFQAEIVNYYNDQRFDLIY